MKNAKLNYVGIWLVDTFYDGPYSVGPVACTDFRRGRGEMALQGHNRGPGVGGWWSRMDWAG